MRIFSDFGTTMGNTYQLSESTMLSIRVVSSVLQGIGILLSLLRLWFRLRIRRLWWEDAWSFIACVCTVLLLISDWMYLKGDRMVSAVGIWIYSLVLTCVIWAVRMSILFSVARMFHSTTRLRCVMTVLAILFVLMFLGFMAGKLWWYTRRDQGWLNQHTFYSKPAPWLPHSMYIYEVCTDCISDVILVCVPVRFLWSVKLPVRQRRMIIAIFSSSMLVTIVSIFRAVTQLIPLQSLVGVATDFEVAFSVITCNLLVVVTLVYRSFQRETNLQVNDSETGSEGDDYTTPVRTRTITPALTTIDLSALGCSECTSAPSTFGSRQEP